jgi:hypothetical protein
VIAAVFIIIIYFVPQYGQTHVMVYIGVCSLVGSLSVCSQLLLSLRKMLMCSVLHKVTSCQTTITIVVLYFEIKGGDVTLCRLCENILKSDIYIYIYIFFFSLWVLPFFQIYLLLR